jgi:hypothetical protein
MLSGISPRIWQQLAKTETFESIPEEDIFKASEILGDATRQAVKVANEWLARRPAPESEAL